MADNPVVAAATQVAPSPSLQEFLETAAPGYAREVSVKIEWNGSRYVLKVPALNLYCQSDACQDDCYFDPDDSAISFPGTDISTPSGAHKFFGYTCRHCKRTRKVFALWLVSHANNTEVISMLKFGEHPPNVGPTPRALQNLLGEQWPLYLQARRSEIAGLGIGAHVYYRRVVEYVWQTVLARLLEVARIDGSADRIAVLEAAQQETRFTASMEMAKEAVPPSLFVSGNNPFQALYGACGNGLHENSDEECIARSRVIRLVLSRFADRAKAILAEDDEYQQALGSIVAKRLPKE